MFEWRCLIKNGIRWKNSQAVEIGSILKKWSPFIDDQSIIRMRSRLENVDFLTFDQRYSIILPKKHHLTLLVFAHYHEKLYHYNHEAVLNELQQRYAIPSLRSQLKLVRSKCMRCRIRDARPAVPEMAALPTISGPWKLKLEGVSRRNGELFTCLTTRAVHVEAVSSLSADAFILVLRVFISRRGLPRRLFSDCGTNFRGAESELTWKIRWVISLHRSSSTLIHQPLLTWVELRNGWSDQSKAGSTIACLEKPLQKTCCDHV